MISRHLFQEIQVVTNLLYRAEVILWEYNNDSPIYVEHQEIEKGVKRLENLIELSPLYKGYIPESWKNLR